MITTDAEARQTLCCGPVGCGFENEGRWCNTNRCMAWRWFDGVTDDGTKVTVTPSIHFARSPDKERPLDQRRGYCAHAGKP